MWALPHIDGRGASGHAAVDAPCEHALPLDARKPGLRGAAGYFTVAQESGWTTQVAQLRASIKGLYEREREIERESNVAETAESQKRAAALYPQLAVADSQLNQEFLRRHNSLKASNDSILQNSSAEIPDADTLAEIHSGVFHAGCVTVRVTAGQL